MFWGVIMEPNKRYTQVVKKPFHISQAAMDIATGDNEPCQVMVVVDNKNFLICTLQKNKTVQVALDLYFKAGDSVSFIANGKCNVHLTGYLDPEFEEEASDDDEEDDEEEEEVEADLPKLVAANMKKRKIENSNDSIAKKPKKDKKKAKNAVADDSSDDEDNDNQLRKFLEGEDVDTDENDESYKLNISGEADSDSDEEDSDDEGEEGEEEEEEDDDDDDEEEQEESSANEVETTLDTSKDSSAEPKLSKSAKRRLKKKLQQQQKQEPKVNGIDKPKEPKETKEKKQDASKKEKDGAAEKKEKKSLSGGVFIEDLKVGNGPAAKAGKTVQVYYEGRLKQNNKMFDNCNKGPGFKFRLGSKEVISGWDVGVAGMKVGGKRKIVCPPAMAYGAKGSPPVIPPNSTLVFEVELKNVK